MRLSHVFLDCFDLAAQRGFYTELLGLAICFEEPGSCAFLDAGGVRLALYPGRSADAASSNLLLVLDVADEAELAAEHARLTHAMTAHGLAPPDALHDVPFGRAFEFQDPEGNRLELHCSRATR